MRVPHPGRFPQPHRRRTSRFPFPGRRRAPRARGTISRTRLDRPKHPNRGASRDREVPDPNRCDGSRTVRFPVVAFGVSDVREFEARVPARFGDDRDLDPTLATADSQVAEKDFGGSHVRTSPPALPSSWYRPPTRSSPLIGRNQRGIRSGSVQASQRSSRRWGNSATPS